MSYCVYIETSIISYLTARPSNDIRSSAHQNSTIEWWENYSSAFDLFVSEYVIAEAAGGNFDAAAKRLKVIKSLPILEVTNKVRELSQSLLHEGALPEKAEIDSLHIAVAAAHGMDYLLTWNCKHIANAIMRPKIENACVLSGCEPPIICTPDELMQE